MSAADDLSAAVRAVLGTDGDRLRTRTGQRLYRAESLTRFVVARMFTGRRVRVVLAPSRDGHHVTRVAQVVAVAEKGYGLQCDVIVLTYAEHAGTCTRAESLATVLSLEEVASP